jgi:hypothetical protein
MITSILWALVMMLFGINLKPNEIKFARHTKSHHIGSLNWAQWFAILSPIVGALLGVLGAFVVER